jgi:Na+-transporting NADH:ubiquinone oxidoreductase subunit NqrC
MKKLRTDTGGYALIYVLIVVLVLCAVAVSVCTAALKNYQAQERSIRQTRQLYQAEGEIEKFVALAEDVKSLKVSSGSCVSEEAARVAAKAAYVTRLSTLVDGCTLTSADTDTDVNSCTFTLTYKNDTACIEIVTEISMALIYDVEPTTTETLPPETTYTAEVIKATHNYNTYTITHLTAEKGGTSE